MSRTHLVTFSDESMSRSRELCAQSALASGVNIIHVWAPHQVWSNWEFYTIEWRQKRGCGYWIWKPWIIKEALDYAQVGDTVVYADAGIEFIAPVSHIINRMDQDIFLFGNNWEHAHWCKRDVVEAIMPCRYEWEPLTEVAQDMRLRSPWDRFGKQAQASVIFFRVSDYTRRFVKEWLDWCLSGARIGAALTFGKDNSEHRDEHGTWSEFRYLIDDSPSVFPNHPEFREHRHDQAILTTMAYREGIKLHWWPAMYNEGAFVYEKLPEYAGDDYPILFHHHRRRNREWKA